VTVNFFTKNTKVRMKAP